MNSVGDHTWLNSMISAITGIYTANKTRAIPTLIVVMVNGNVSYNTRAVLFYMFCMTGSSEEHGAGVYYLLLRMVIVTSHSSMFVDIDMICRLIDLSRLM